MSTMSATPKDWPGHEPDPAPWWDADLSSYLSRLESQRGLSEHTVAAYRRDLTQFFRHAESVGIESAAGVDRTSIRVYLAHLDGEGYARRSVARKISAIRAYLSEAVRRLSLIHI